MVTLQYPLTLTLQVVEYRGKRQFKILREQDLDGTVRSGREMCGKIPIHWSVLDSVMFGGEADQDVRIQLFEVGNKSVTCSLYSYTVYTLGGHYNGDTLFRRDDNPTAKYQSRLDVTKFKPGQILVISGYKRSLASDPTVLLVFAER